MRGYRRRLEKLEKKLKPVIPLVFIGTDGRVFIGQKHATEAEYESLRADFEKLQAAGRIEPDRPLRVDFRTHGNDRTTLRFSDVNH